jgi:zinc/manganese transport system permease protein
MNLAGLDLGILGPALVAGMLVLVTHVPLGIQVLSRGIVFADLAVAQIAGLGVIAAHGLGWEVEGWGAQAAAVSAAVAGALLLNWTEKRWTNLQEALIGALFVLAATAGILLLAHDVRGGEHLRDLLVGQILWVGYRQLLLAAVVTFVLAALWFGLGRKLGRLGFYVLFAVAVTVSVQLVGIYLVFASLILPALATRRLAPRLPWGYGLGLTSYGLGLLLATLFDFPPGPLIVWVMAALGLVLFALGRQPENGL